MSLLDDLRKKLKPEDMQTVEDILGDDFNWDLVPRTRLDKVIKQRNELKKQVGLQEQNPPSSKDGNDDGDGDSGTSYSADEVQKLLKAERDKVGAVELKYATLSKLQDEKALDTELVFGLLDASKLSFNDKHEVQGLKEAGLDSIKESRPFLFAKGDSDDSGVPGGTGKSGSKGGDDKGGDAVDAAIANIFSGYGVVENSN